MEEKTHPFVEYLESLREDRGALAALRRGLGHPPGAVADMYRYVVPWLPNDAPPWEEAPYYLVATLFAYHPDKEGKGAGQGNMGNHFAQARDPQSDNAALERRFTTLLTAHPDDLDVYLRQAVSFLKSKDVPVNWHRLFYDLRGWGHPNRYVQKRWAGSFWGKRKPEEEKEKAES